MRVVNEAQRRYWASPQIATFWPRREHLTNAVTPTLLERARLRDGMHVLDIGSGTGTATLAAARAVGTDGWVAGADISEVQVDGATRRAAALGADNVRFSVADVQVDDLWGAPFDACISQFGVMFFEDPVAAFTNVRRQTAQGGRLAFACWRDPALNPWFPADALAPFLPPTDTPPTVGPFAFADCTRVEGILAQAGWKDVETSPCETSVVVERTALVVTDDELTLRGVAPHDHTAARRALEMRFAPLQLADGRFQVPVSYQVITAVA